MSTIQSTISSMLSGSLSEEEIVGIFEELNKEPMTVDQLVAGATAMREAMVPVSFDSAQDDRKNPIDTCGTGGSGLRTINTSTLVAFTITACGGSVAKHGNRSASGNCGSFDVLEGLGAQIELIPEQEEKIYSELGIVFLFAKSHHPAMRFVGPARKAFGRKTLFNLLGPLCNPAGVQRQMIGTSNADDAALMLGALQALGSERGIVVTGSDGLDEVTVCSTTHVQSFGLNLDDDYTFDPKELGIEYCDPSAIEGGTVEENVEVLKKIAEGGGTEEQRNLIIVNAAHALLLTDLVDSFADSVMIITEVLRSGKVLEVMEKYVEVSNDV